MPLETHKRSDILMDTVLSQELYCSSPQRHETLSPRHLKKVSARVAAEIRRLEGLWSVFRPESDTARLSEAAGRHTVAGRHAAPVSQETWRLLHEAKSLSEACGGRFDVTAAPLVELWRAAAAKDRLPRPARLEKARSLVDWRSISLEETLGPQEYRVFLPKRGQRIDFGGIGKGAAADRAAALLKNEGIESGYINFGGNVAAIGVRPDGKPWRIGIRNPQNPAGRDREPFQAIIGFLEVEDAAVATSAAYERWFEIGGIRYPHIIDPGTGRPVENDLLSATVAAKSAAAADAFATALYVAGLQDGLGLLEALPIIGGLLIDRDGTVYLSSGLRSSFPT